MTPKYSTMNQKKKMLERLFLGHPVQFVQWTVHYKVMGIKVKFTEFGHCSVVI